MSHDTTDSIWWDSDVRGKPPARYRLSMQGWQDTWEGLDPTSGHPRYMLGFKAGEEALGHRLVFRAGKVGTVNIINRGTGMEAFGWR